jgi:hypothetical protein
MSKNPSQIVYILSETKIYKKNDNFNIQKIQFESNLSKRNIRKSLTVAHHNEIG